MKVGELKDFVCALEIPRLRLTFDPLRDGRRAIGRQGNRMPIHNRYFTRHAQASLTASSEAHRI
jgi:hypothetical protein